MKKDIIRYYGNYDLFFEYIRRLSYMNNFYKYIDDKYFKDDDICFILQIKYLLTDSQISSKRQILYNKENYIKVYKNWKNGDICLRRYINNKDMDQYLKEA